MRIDWVLMEPDSSGVSVGDVVSSEAGGMPLYRVVALREGRAWLRDEAHAEDMVCPLNRFRWKAAPIAS